MDKVGANPSKRLKSFFRFSSDVLEADMSREISEIYEFAGYRLDVGERTFERTDGVKNGSLPEKAFQTLTVLVRNHGRLVTKQELLESVWPDSFVEENNLDKCIHAIRQALGETPREDRYIETVRKHGYRFVAEVSRIDHNTHSDTLSDGTTSSTKLETAPDLAVLNIPGGETAQITQHDEILPGIDRVRSIRSIWFAAVAIGVLVGLTGLSYYVFQRANRVETTHKIAVLPARPIIGGNRDELFELAIADALIHRLSQVKGFFVRPLGTVRKYSGMDEDPQAVGQEQKVDYVLISNYQLVDGRIRITSQLLNVDTGQIVETYQTEQDASDTFKMQDAIAIEVGNRLIKVFATTWAASSYRRTSNEEAYRLYLQGMYLYNQREKAGARKAIEALTRAVSLDPNYALAWAGKAHAHRSFANFGRDTDLKTEYEHSMEAIDKALALDPDLSEAFSALCENKMYYEWDFDEAERACKRAIELEPGSSLAHQIYSRYLNSRGRHEEAINEIKIAIDLDPSSLFVQRLYGNALLYARRYDEAAEQFRRVMTMDDNFGSTYMWLSQTLGLQGKDAEAYEVWQKFLARNNADEEMVRSYQDAFETSGWHGVMEERARRFDAGSEVYFHGAAYNALIGNRDRAFELLQRSYDRRELWMAYLNVDQRLDPIRTDPRFRELVRTVGLE